ncbi:MAG: putative GTPase family, partial [Deltaproteobacteria bacterium]|nr:putative GTPase family [Deltaproteobacteria bacterium]
MPTPIYVISGFLGAGKTTLINNLLESAPYNARIMVLVNEFGRISIDKKMIKADPSNIVDLSGGCICCGMATELIASLRFALDELRADVILIESTGLAIPQEIARQALSPVFEGRVEGGGIVTVVDAGSVLKADYPIIEAQLKEANAVVLNKIDLIDSKTLEEVRDRIKLITDPKCSLFETSFGRISYNAIFTRRYDSPPILYTKTRPGEFDSTVGFTTVCFVRSSAINAD